ncbi:MAG TPA: alpha/beta hydrolase fold domain-containing protein [Polyangiaceae bacterium]|nr:alpha/beta hydrolase fold domain-containing protein [Polyangiaceae bacterium]
MKRRQFLALPFTVAGQIGRPRRLHIIGDSTAAEFPPTDPRVGWGAALGLQLSGVAVNDAARSGRSSKSYWDEGHFRVIAAQLGPGDLLLIQFGHNDEKDDPARHTEPTSTFTDNLLRYVSEARARGALPVLLTPIARRRFAGDVIEQTHGGYPDATRAVATGSQTPLIDLTARTSVLFERFGPSASERLFAPDDNTHLSPEGAAAVARLVAEGLRELGFDFGLRQRAPSLAAYPARGSAPVPAVIVCPGGGYTHLAIEKEGLRAATWLNSLGISAFILRYRLADWGHPAPLEDVRAAIAWVRHNASSLGIDSKPIGILGFSAGGHLAACASTLFRDDTERPDFALLAYPVITFKDPYAHTGSRRALLGPRPDPVLLDALSLEAHVTSRTPPTFLMHTRDDASVPVENSLLYAEALQRAGVPHQLAVYDHGPHGLGFNSETEAGREWPGACARWLKSRGIV